nr:PREDICTED: uncharacterized protein LOC109031935 isoform X1 [Bemisia tabaci]
MDLEKRLNTFIFPEAVDAGCFGDDVEKFVSFEIKRHPGKHQFCSDATFGDITLQKTTGLHFNLPVFVKTRNRSEFPPRAEADAMFHNEIFFYTKIVPILRRYDEFNILSTSFPEFVCGKKTSGQNPEDDVIVLKDLRQRGFRSCGQRHFDENHLSLVLDRLGKFHGLSLLWQMDNPTLFQEVTARIKLISEAKFWAALGGIQSKEVFRQCMFRGVDPLREEPKYRNQLTDLCASFEDADERMDALADASGPLTVLAHGDFHASNVMFKYGAHGKPIEVAFFDFGTIKLCSPAIDLCHFLLVSVSPQMKQDRWGELLYQYYGALSHQIGDDLWKPSFETFDLDLRRKGVHAYYVIAAILPAVMSINEGTEIPRPPKSVKRDQTALNEEMEAYMRNMKELGGTFVTDLLAEIVRHMIDKKFIF